MEVQEITGQEVLAAVKNGSVFYDVREDYEVAEVAYDIVGGNHIPLGEIQERIAEFPKDREVIIGCRSGARSMNACMFLKMQGFENVKNLRGGIMQWVADGLPTK